MVDSFPKHVQADLRRRNRICKYEVIREIHEEKGWSILWMCRVLKVSRAAYYKWLNRKETIREAEDRVLLAKIQEICAGNGNLFGYRKMAMVLSRELEVPVSRKRIHRLMSVNRIYSSFRPRTRKRYPKSDPEVKQENRLNRNFEADGPNRKWVTDITEMRTSDGRKLYISSILDLYDRYPIAWCFSSRNDTELVSRTLKKALENNDPSGVLFHSDRGFQYTRKVFQKQLEELGMSISMSRVSHCIDNGPMEGFQGLIKDMCRVLYPEARSRKELEVALNNTFMYYIEHYPQERFGGKTSGEVRKEAMDRKIQTQYPIAPNPKIIRFWAKIEEKKGQEKILQDR